jgi:hypothetical protein
MGRRIHPARPNESREWCLRKVLLLKFRPLRNTPGCLHDHTILIRWRGTPRRVGPHHGASYSEFLTTTTSSRFSVILSFRLYFFTRLFDPTLSGIHHKYVSHLNTKLLSYEMKINAYLAPYPRSSSQSTCIRFVNVLVWSPGFAAEVSMRVSMRHMSWRSSGLTTVWFSWSKLAPHLVKLLIAARDKSRCLSRPREASFVTCRYACDTQNIAH